MQARRDNGSWARRIATRSPDTARARGGDRRPRPARGSRSRTESPVTHRPHDGVTKTAAPAIRAREAAAAQDVHGRDSKARSPGTALAGNAMRLPFAKLPARVGTTGALDPSGASILVRAEQERLCLFPTSPLAIGCFDMQQPSAPSRRGDRHERSNRTDALRRLVLDGVPGSPKGPAADAAHSGSGLCHRDATPKLRAVLDGGPLAWIRLRSRGSPRERLPSNGVLQRIHERRSQGAGGCRRTESNARGGHAARLGEP
jgi:hypothetical protein